MELQNLFNEVNTKVHEEVNQTMALVKSLDATYDNSGIAKPILAFFF
jgi:hypothetical protein